jgi:hypothetical protein
MKSPLCHGRLCPLLGFEDGKPAENRLAIGPRCSMEPSITSRWYRTRVSKASQRRLLLEASSTNSLRDEFYSLANSLASGTDAACVEVSASRPLRPTGSCDARSGLGASPFTMPRVLKSWACAGLNANLVPTSCTGGPSSGYERSGCTRVSKMSVRLCAPACAFPRRPS